MTDKSGGPAYPLACDVETCPHTECKGMNLRERFAVAIVTGGVLHPEACDMPASWVLSEAQKLVNQCVARRKQDAEEQPE